ncbi:MAG: response regulator transcription factor [Elusimicrobia bacterium]|nr:response regulator transcription factor [Elusimicrobiota bacterium]
MQPKGTTLEMTPAAPSKSKVLVIDDDPTILSLVRRYLTSSGYGVVGCSDGSDALLMARECDPDIVVTDAQMPGLDGHALCRVLRKDTNIRQVPIIIMSGSMITDKDIVAGFEGGADDYLIKPFSLPVFQARLEAVLRRYRAANDRSETLSRCGIELDPAGRTVKIRGKEISLTRKEFDLLATLIAKSGRVLNTLYLLQTVWGYDPADYNDPGTVEVHVSHLRKKLGPTHAKRIVTVAGLGYKFVAD